MTHPELTRGQKVHEIHPCENCGCKDHRFSASDGDAVEWSCLQCGTLSHR